MPSKLVAIHDAPSGCELELVDRSRIALNVTHETVRNYVIRDGFRDLKSFVDAKRIDVYFQPVAISMTEWVHNRNTYSLDDWPLALTHDGGFGLRRRISAIYGVANYYKHPGRDDPSGPGWNRRLWKSVGDVDPEQLVDDIFDRVAALIGEARGV